jgi:hypothetical protein
LNLPTSAWGLRTNREGLLDLLTERFLPHPPLPGLEDLHRPSGPSELALVWAGPPPRYDRLPRAIFLGTPDASDFLAWANTYLAGHLPLTSLIRIIPARGDSGLFPFGAEWRILKAAEAWVTASIAETLEAQELPTRPADLPLRAFLNSTTFAVGRAIAQGLGVETVRDLPSALDRCHELVTPAYAAVNGKATRRRSRPFSLLAQLEGLPIGNVPDDVAEACALLRTGASATTALREVEIQGVDSTLRVMEQEPRDKRVRYFDSFVQQYRHSNADPDRLAFVVGLLGNSIAADSLQHWELMWETSRTIPGALQWYGACAGLSGDGAVLTEGDGLGRRVARELLRQEPFLERPRCDFALDEFELMAHLSPLSRSWPARTGGQVTIDVAPQVQHSVRWPDGDRVSQLGLFSGTEGMANSSLPEIRDLLQRAISLTFPDNPSGRERGILPQTRQDTLRTRKPRR